MTEKVAIKMSKTFMLDRVVSTFLDILILNGTKEDVDLLDILTEFIKLFTFSLLLL